MRILKSNPKFRVVKVSSSSSFKYLKPLVAQVSVDQALNILRLECFNLSRVGARQQNTFIDGFNIGAATKGHRQVKLFM